MDLWVNWQSVLADCTEDTPEGLIFGLILYNSFLLLGKLYPNGTKLSGNVRLQISQSLLKNQILFQSECMYDFHVYGLSGVS